MVSGQYQQLAEAATKTMSYISPWMQLAETAIRGDDGLQPSDWAAAIGGTLSSAARARERIADGGILRRIKQWLTAAVVERGENGKERISGGRGNRRGTPRGGVIHGMAIEAPPDERGGNS